MIRTLHAHDESTVEGAIAKIEAREAPPPPAAPQPDGAAADLGELDAAAETIVEVAIAKARQEQLREQMRAYLSRQTAEIEKNKVANYLKKSGRGATIDDLPADFWSLPRGGRRAG